MLLMNCCRMVTVTIGYALMDIIHVLTSMIPISHPNAAPSKTSRPEPGRDQMHPKKDMMICIDILIYICNDNLFKCNRILSLNLLSHPVQLHIHWCIYVEHTQHDFFMYSSKVKTFGMKFGCIYWMAKQEHGFTSGCSLVVFSGKVRDETRPPLLWSDGGLSSHSVFFFLSYCETLSPVLSGSSRQVPPRPFNTTSGIHFGTHRPQHEFPCDH